MKLSMMVVMTSCAPVRALRKPAMRGPDGASDDGRHQRQRDVNDRRDGKAEADPQRRHAADVHLTVDTDVEQTGLEADRNGKAGEDERSRREQVSEIARSEPNEPWNSAL